MKQSTASGPVSLRPEDRERAIQNMIARHLFKDAANAAAALREDYPDRVSGYILGGHVAIQAGDIDALQSLAARAEDIASERLDVAFLQVDAHIRSGAIAGALKRLSEIANGRATTSSHFELLASKWMELGRYEEALDAGRELSLIDGAEVAGLAIIAAAQTSLGRMAAARKTYDRLLRLAPEMTDGWYLRSSLQKARVDDNHIQSARRRLMQLKPQSPPAIPLHYALGRELEELGDHAGSFAHIREGATIRRQQLAYDVESDAETMQQIADVFDQSWVSGMPSSSVTDRPIFVLGLPRSGTTLVDRILSSHSCVESLGEINDLAYAVVRLAGSAASKRDLLRASAQISPNQLGADYMAALRGYGRCAVMLLDKTPANYLYLGLILKALPQARIVHLKRHPVASGYAMYKTLFRMGYPFSYDLTDLGRYIAAYETLMAHWYRVFPGRIETVHYENLVTRQESESRRLIDHCQLDWEEACLWFDKNLAPTATASAAQVREPIHNRSVDLWKCYKDQLMPLFNVLRSEGVNV